MIFAVQNMINIAKTSHLNKIAIFLIPDKVPKTTQKFGAYVFGNVFHYLYWKNDTTTMNQYWNSSLSDNSRMGRDYENKTRKLLNEGSLHIPYLITQMKIKRTFNCIFSFAFTSQVELSLVVISESLKRISTVFKSKCVQNAPAIREVLHGVGLPLPTLLQLNFVTKAILEPYIRIP